MFTVVESDWTKPGAPVSARSLEESSAFRPRKVAPLSTQSLRHPVSDAPSADQQRKHRQVDCAVQRMLVMAYFGAWNEPYDPAEERLLAEVRLLGRSTLHVSS